MGVFYLLNDLLFEQDVFIEIIVYDGSAMILAYDSLRSTQDLDCMFTVSDKSSADY